MLRSIALSLCVATCVSGAAAGQSGAESAAPENPTLADGQRLFYNAHYEAAAATMHAALSPEADALPLLELRTSALLFQLKGLLEGPAGRDADRKEADKKAALRSCGPCPDLIAAFFADIGRGQALARARLKANPHDHDALFYLGKLDLNYVWLQLGPLGRRTGWDEFWEARRSLDAVIKAQPGHVRALVARAWIDYIVDTKMPWGTAWLLGGGNKKRGLKAVRAATEMEADFFTHTEAEFALWNMLVRERDIAQATVVARRLALGFPDNLEVAAFLRGRETAVRR